MFIKHTGGLRRLEKSEEGTVAVIVALAMLVLVGAMGAAVDMARGQLVQAKLASSLDSAGLAAGSNFSTTTLTTEVTKYVNANFQNYMGATISNLAATANSDGSVINVSATATLPTTLMQVFGTETLTVSASSEITRAASGLELVLVLDNTGSMCMPCSKLTGLKTAAKALLDILFGDKATGTNLWVGVVPFAQAVNIGSSRTGWTTADSYNWGTTSWMGCVEAREASDRDVTDDPASVATFPKYYWACNRNYNAWYGSNGDRDNCRMRSSTEYQDNLGTSLGPNKSCPQEVTPMTATKATLVTAVDAMQAVGYTHIVLGASWGWRMLSPRWQTLWGGEMNTNSLPLAYNTTGMNKAVVIMTDGDNTMSNEDDGAYGYLSDGTLGTTDQSNAENELDERLLTVCTSMKNNNILVFTVSFGTLSDESKDMLRACASQNSYYFHSPDSAALKTAFQTIGDTLSNLRVSK